MVRIKTKKISLCFLICLLFSSVFLTTIGLEASVKLTGSIKGKIVGPKGESIEGAYVYLSSPSLIGIQYFLTRKNGYYFFHQLPTGIYKMAVETPGYKTAIINGIKVETGKTLSLPVALEVSESDESEEKILLYPLPALDKEKPGISYLIDKNILSHVPKTKDLASWLQLAPGVVPETPPFNLNFSVNGSTVRGNVLTLSGNEINDSITHTPLSSINVDWVEEIEIENAGHPVENYSSEGAFIKLITSSGGNKSSGELNFFATGGKFSHSLWNQSELDRMSNLPAIEDKYHLDFSLSLGGALMPDRIWYFTNFRYNRRAQSTPFSPWRDPANIPYPMYSWKTGDFKSLFRISSQVTSEFQATLLLSFNKNNQSVDPSFISPFNPQIATLDIHGQKLFMVNVFGNYKLDQETLINGFFYYTKNDVPRRLYYKGDNNPRYLDLGSGYAWGSGPFNDDTSGGTFRAGLSATRYQTFLNIFHELVAGAEYESTNASYSTWKNDNLIYYYLYGSPYYYGQGISPESGNLVGKGLIGFYLASSTQNGLTQGASLHRLIFYLRDSFSLAKKLSLYLGLKFERTQSGLSNVYKVISGNSISYYMGENLIKPLYGLNPYAASTFHGWDNMIVWNYLSPRLGLVIDILGTGKTLLKGSFSRYYDHLSLSYLLNFSPVSPNGYHLFYWYDENQDGLANLEDTYRLLPEDYRIHQNDYFRKRISPDLKAPTTTEWTATLEQQFTEDFTLSISYINKVRTRLIEDVLYDPDANREWYSVDNSEGLWIPFHTVVPGQGVYTDTQVTVYFPSADAPAFFTRLSNVKDLRQKYSALQLVLRKRMSGKWQLLASGTWSKAQGNAGLGSLASTYLTQLANSPNSLVNVSRSSLLDLDRPLSIKVMGTYRLPKEFYLSGFFSYLSGAPWARTVTIIPPDSWLETHQARNFPATVYLEEPGSRRWPAFHTLDLRLERSFRVGQNTTLNLSLDVLNVLGKKYALEDNNDGGYWYPQTEGSSSGTRIFSSSYQKILSVYGTRAAQLNFSLRF